MIQKLKEFGAWVLTPLFFLFGTIFLLWTRNQALRDEVRKEKSARELGETLGNLERAKETADEREDSFDRKLADFKRATSNDSEG